MMDSWRYLDWLEARILCKISRTLASVARMWRRMEASSLLAESASSSSPMMELVMVSSRKRLGVRARNRWEMGVFFLPGPVVLDGASAPQHGGHLQQLPGVQAAPHIRPVEAGPHGLDAGEAGAPPLNEHLHRGGGLLLGPLHIVRVGHGPQGQTALLPLLGGGAGGQLLQHPGSSRVAMDFSNRSVIILVSCLC